MKPPKIPIKPMTVIRCANPKCKELMAKMYPYATISFAGDPPFCIKCINKKNGY